MNLCGLIRDTELRTRLSQLAAANGWQLALVDSEPALMELLSGMTPHPDVVLSDCADVFFGLGPSSATQIYLGSAPDLDSSAAIVDPQQSDAALLQEIRTCINARRFRARFAELDRTEPITRLPRHEELFESLASYQGRPLGLVILQLDHAEHLYENLDPVGKTDMLSALSEHIKDAIPYEGRLGFYDAACFVIALPTIHPADMGPLCERLLELVRKPVGYRGGEIHLTVSVGHNFDASFTSAERLWSGAWQALQVAQRDGGDCARGAHDESMSQRIPDALDREEFALLLQGQWHVEQQRFTGVEALIRWQGMEVGELAPSHFIPIAEERGHMARIGDWVMEKACREASTWYQTLVEPLQLAVNVSPQQFHQDAITNQIRRFSAERWLEPSTLELELKQDDLLHLVDAHRDQLFTLRDWGVRFALDNLGSGLIDARKLLRCPVDTLKIDRQVVSRLPDDGNAADLVGQICELGARFRVRVVAVGVESEAQLGCLQELGCTTVQGYLLAPPVPLADFFGILSQAATHTASH